MILSCVLACVVEVLWFKIMAFNLWNDSSSMKPGVLAMGRFTVVTSALYFICRIVLFIILVYNYYALSEIEAENMAK